MSSSAVMSCAGEHQEMGVRSDIRPQVRVLLDAQGWSQRVGVGLGVWVSVSEQRVYGIQDGKVVFAFPCSTAARGLGEAEGSLRTPRGWHVVADKIGDGLPAGAVLKDRIFTGEIMTTRTDDTHDHILTRILRLQGVEPARNAGPGVDSYDRYIYIHGTSAEHKIGAPASAGCIRICNLDVIELFDRVPAGTPVFVTE